MESPVGGSLLFGRQPGDLDPERQDILQPLLVESGSNGSSIEAVESKAGISCPSRINPSRPSRPCLRNRGRTGTSPPEDGRNASADHSRPESEQCEVHNRRLLDRDAPFFQSRGRWSVQHLSRQAARFHHRPDGGAPTRVARSKQFWDGWFHALAYQRTVVLLSILVIIYAVIVFTFGSIYYALSTWGQKEQINPDGSVTTIQFCAMDITTHMEALYFSLSTMSTIGYGVSDYYFGGCWSPLLLVLLEVCCGISFAAVATSLLFLRVSRGHKRGKTILFSDRAVVRNVRGIPHLMFRVVELRRHQLLGAHVRAYAIRHERHAVTGVVVDNNNDDDDDDAESHLSNAPRRITDPLSTSTQHQPVVVETIHYVTKPLRLLNSDAYNNHVPILMSLPQVLVHRIDASSPLLPPRPIWYNARGEEAHRSQSANEPFDGSSSSSSSSIDEIQQFLQDRETEIVVTLEGMDELTGTSIQSRHSYSTRDLSWHQTFVPCVFPYREEEDDGDVDEPSGQRRPSSTGIFRTRRTSNPRAGCVVDFGRFHDTAPAPRDCESCPYVVE